MMPAPEVRLHAMDMFDSYAEAQEAADFILQASDDMDQAYRLWAATKDNREERYAFITQGIIPARFAAKANDHQATTEAAA